MFLVASSMVSSLIYKKSDLEYQLAKINQEIQDLKAYAENIADGGVSIGEMLNTPSTMYGRQLMYMNSASQYCQLSAQNQMQQLMQTPYYQNMMAQQQADVQQSYQNLMYKSFYDKAQAQFARYESKLLHEKEKALEQKKTSIQSNLEICKTQLSHFKQETQQGISDFYGNGNRG